MANPNQKQIDATQKIRGKHIAWKCALIDKRQRRRGGLAHREGCGHWQVFSPRAEAKNPQAVCRKCKPKRKCRLNPDRRVLKVFNTRDEARAFCAAKNGDDLPEAPAYAYESLEAATAHADIMNRHPTAKPQPVASSTPQTPAIGDRCGGCGYCVECGFFLEVPQ